ncbi:LysM peptidoglycan-binding domain-containing protein [Halomonas sp. HP20-15]|uniref:LysM peptidoglycan-binding domain-containing protein n=1 Tax=Halomonas sp. HP20-15 TaxID=3085901 RepID=UPI002980CC41|nr:LysM peptidoglycan-binding domain-containing protein [Halomonas sp. HP20-15]MDW5375586.1 LysM peptidoglycan-binding domain-containing protein [Halomonas sp. HP20-15]
MAQCPMAGKGRQTRLAALILLLLVLSGCASHSRPTISDTAPLAGNWVSIRPGDTLGELARRANVPLLRLQRFNPGVQARQLRVGQRILIPTQRERAPGGGPYRYQIRPGDTYTEVARLFDTTAARIQAANRGLAPDQLRVGQLIQVPLTGSVRRTAASAPKPSARRAASLPDPGPLPKQQKNWPWPLDDYRLVRSFGRDSRGTLQPMLLATQQGKQAHAVADGDVRFANSMRQLGQVVIVHHSGNLQSVYALCGDLKVKEGQSIKAGTPLCTVSHNATTGRYDLLFDVRHGGKPIDPRQVLR